MSPSPSLTKDKELIAALATSPGFSALAVIRVSGDGCWEALSKFFSVKELAPNVAKYCNFQDQNIIDDVMVTYFKGPKSFTGQDSLEIACHGGSYIVQKVLETLYSGGARPAEPGEYTKRALLNGKLDVTQAEAIKHLVEAQSEQEWLVGRELMTGRLAELVNKLRDKLIHAMAYLEARIDFPDEGDTQSVHLTHVRSVVTEVSAALKNLRDTFDDGRVMSQGLKVAFFAEPNAGKSTLFNKLLGKDRAIVSNIAGTTRDYLEERCMLKGRLFRLIDMAGIRETDDQVEKEGVERALNIASDADVLLVLVPSDASSEEITSVMEQAAKIKIREKIICATKNDLGKTPEVKLDLSVSCQTGNGMDMLIDLLVDKVDQAKNHFKKQVSLTSERQKLCIDEALKMIANFERIQDKTGIDEFLAFELQHASKALHEIVGAITNDDVLDKIFREFCVGK